MLRIRPLTACTVGETAAVSDYASETVGASSSLPGYGGGLYVHLKTTQNMENLSFSARGDTQGRDSKCTTIDQVKVRRPKQNT